MENNEQRCANSDCEGAARPGSKHCIRHQRSDEVTKASDNEQRARELCGCVPCGLWISGSKACAHAASIAAALDAAEQRGRGARDADLVKAVRSEIQRIYSQYPTARMESAGRAAIRNVAYLMGVKLP